LKLEANDDDTNRIEGKLMLLDSAISIEGLRSAENSLAESAHKIASMNLLGSAQNEQKPTADVDFDSALIQANQAKIAAKANLKMISSEQDLNQSVLDVLA
jgi:hypothetical protein